jgi:branched-chain amino acid aminotransferase
MSIFFSYDGKWHRDGEPVVAADSRGLRYGDGLFETIKVVNGNLLLGEYHFERLFNGMQALCFDIPSFFTADFLEKEIFNLAEKNNHGDVAKIRLMVFRADGVLGDYKNALPHYIIQTSALSNDFSLNNTGFSIDVYSHAKKSCDIFSNIKTNNFLPYVMAAMHAKKNNLDDCILLNSSERISDTTIANLFIIKDKKIYTTPLREGCIAGVMRRWLLENIQLEGNSIIETPLSIDDLKQADEAFLTNSIQIVRWVKRFDDVHYGNEQIKNLYPKIINNLP